MSTSKRKVSLSGELQKEPAGTSKKKGRGESSTGGEQGVDNNSSPGVPAVSTSRLPKRVQAPKLKTLTDIAYDIMASSMSASLGNSKAKVYDYWIDMSAAEKQKYIGQARAAVKAMSPAELKSVQLTAEEIAELGIVIVKKPSAPAAAAAPAEAEAEAAPLSSGVEDDGCIKYREGREEDDAAQEARRNARNSRGRLLQSKPSIASLQSLTGSFVEDDEALADDASDNYADMDIVNDESARTPLNLNFLKKRLNADGTEKVVQPSLGLQYQAALEPWVPAQDRLGDYAHLGERDRVERAAAGCGSTWSCASKGDKAEITSAFLKEALVVLKNAMYNKLIEIAHKRQKQMSSSKTPSRMALAPVVDGHMLALRSDCTESLLQLLYDCKFQADTALDSLRQQCQQSEAAFFSTWSHVEQERAYTAFAKFGDDVGRISSAVPSKMRDEVVDYYFRFIEAGRFLETECRIDDCLRQAEQEALALNSSDADGGCSDFYRARGLLHNFELPASLASSLPPNVLEATEAVAKEAEDFARTFGQNNPQPAKPKVGRPSRDGVKKENASLDQLQKIKSIAFMIKARSLLDDVCFTFLLNSLTEYRRSTLSPAELVVRMRWICHFASDNPLLSVTADVPAARSSSSGLQQQSKDEALGDLFDTFLQFLPRPIELLLCKA